MAYYPFNGNSNDESGFRRDGVATAITYNSDFLGHSGKSAFFTTGSAIDIPDLTGIQFRPTTYCLSVYLNSVQENSQTTLIGRKQAWNQEDGALTIETRFGQNRELMYHTGGTAMTSGLTLDIGQWYQIIFTQDANYHASFYVNGRLLKNQIFTAEQTAMAFPFRLGAESALSGVTTGSGIFNGNMDNVRIYNRSLSSSEASALYASERPRFQIIKGSFTWHEAKSDAETRGGKLAVLNTQANQLEVASLLPSSSHRALRKIPCEAS